MGGRPTHCARGLAGCRSVTSEQHDIDVIRMNDSFNQNASESAAETRWSCIGGVKESVFKTRLRVLTAEKRDSFYG